MNKKGFLPITIIMAFVIYTAVYITVMAIYFAAVDFGQALPGTETYKGVSGTEHYQNTISLLSFLRTNAGTETTVSEAITELQKAQQENNEAAFNKLTKELDEAARTYTDQYKKCILIDATDTTGKESLLWQHKSSNCKLISARQLSDRRLRADAELPTHNAKATIKVIQRTGEAE
ncbi:hypothetical protein HY640_04605 [Candidatus Woesearchaeota archaeon]|nr:hypothetical protein [Candidatus Woesearchaeota archaeon]